MRIFTPAEKVANARMSLALEYPFYGSIFFRLNIVEDPTCPTAWVDGTTLGYNLKWLSQWNHNQIIGVFCHEIIHVIYKHHLREELSPRFKEKHHKFNRAADYALNPAVIREPGMDLPPGCLLDLKRWSDELAEVIFGQLDDEDDNDSLYGGKGNPAGVGPGTMPGEVRPFKKGKASPAEKAIEGNKVDQWVRAAAMKAQGMGKMDGHTSRMIKQVVTPTVKWEDELQMMVESMCKDDYTWSRPNNRFTQQGMYLPSMHGQTMPDMIFFVDTSGSLNERQLAHIMAEVRRVIDQFRVRVIVVYWDTAYRYHEEFLPEDVLDPSWTLNAKGHGGTGFRKCWEWMDENQDDIDPAGIIFFTDCETDEWPMDDPGIPVIWCQVPSDNGRYIDSYIGSMPKYGSHVKIPHSV